MSSNQDYAKKAVKRFYLNLENGIKELIKDKSITENTTVKELLIICKNKTN